MNLLRGYIGTIISVAFIAFTVGYFYTQVIADENMFGLFLLGVVFLSASTDGFLILLSAFRKRHNLGDTTFDPNKMSVLIACFNGQHVIEETVRQVLTKVPKEQVFVVSDASTDNTESVVRKLGVNLIVNDINKNKALSISHSAHHIKTPYTLILDDDTHIEKTHIPTSLLDDGYSAVAFEVMPEPSDTLVNKFQQFEYRKSMVFGKELRSSAGAIGNVSGAIGLFKTEDLVAQAKRHSGQFGGEDQQRTMMVHLDGEGKGVAYCNSTVLTEAPPTFRKLFRQRYRSWNCSTHETFIMCWQIILDPKLHFLLKIERAYLIFILLTDPIRMVFFAGAILHPLNIVILYFFYLLLETIGWLRTRRKDAYYVVLLTPFYGMYKSVARFIAHFWWFKLKYDYLIKNRFHRFVTERPIVEEYLIVLVVLLTMWILSFVQLARRFWLE